MLSTDKSVLFSRGGINFFPMWYHKYLVQFEPDAELPPAVRRPGFLQKAPRPEAVEKVEELKPEHKAPVSVELTPKRQPTLQMMQNLSEYIMANGGPQAIETMPVPNAMPGRSYLLKLRKGLNSQQQ